MPGRTGAASESKSVEDLLLEPYEETVDIHVVLQYRESEDPLTPTDCTPETSTAVKKLKEDLNINLIYDWIVNADSTMRNSVQSLQQETARRIMVGPNDFEDLASQGGLADLTEAYETYKCDALDNIFNYDGNFLNVGTKDGSVYGLPMGTDPAQATSQMYYNMNTAGERRNHFCGQLPKTIE